MKKITMMLVIAGAIISFSIGCGRKEKNKFKDDFKHLMGCQTHLWQHVVTDEDRGYLQLFEKVYNQNKHLRQKRPQKEHIPQTVHFIWLGPKEFPKQSIKNVASWIENHPDWHFKFWTDRRRAAPHEKMEVIYFEDYPYKELYQNFFQSTNYAEKSDVLRYEILYNEGGVYVDHDVICFKPFDSLSKNYDLFCALEPPHSPIISSSISVCNNLIGVVPKHPFLADTIKKVKNRWDRIERSFPGLDQESTIYRIAHRTFSPFDETVRTNITHSNLKNIVLPAGYFNEISKGTGLYAHHFFDGTWYKNDDPFEHLVRKQLKKMARKSNKMLLLGGISILLNLLFAICMIFQYRMIRALGKR